MPLTLVTGRANSGKTGIAYGVLREAVDAGRAATLLVPTLPDVQRARRELAEASPVGLSVEQIDAYLTSRWDASGDGRTAVSPAQRRLLAERAVRSAGLCAADSPVEGVAEVVAALAARAAEQGVEVPPLGHRRTGPDLVFAVAEYRRSLTLAGLIEPPEAARRLAAGLPPVSIIVLHRFVDLTASQEAVVLGWSERGADVWLTLPYDPAVAATLALQPIVERLCAQGARVRSAPATSAYSPSPELARLETELFAVTGQRPPTGDVRLALAQGDEAEARLIVRSVAGLLKRGLPAERIAVTFRDLPRHQSVVRRELAAAGIAADIDVAVPFGATPFGRAFLRLWAVAAGGDDDAIAFLRTPFAGADPAVADRADFARRRRSRKGTVPAGFGVPAADVLLRRARALQRAGESPPDGAAWKKLADALLGNAYPGDAPILTSADGLDAAAHRLLLRIVCDVAALARIGVTGSDVADAVRRSSVSIPPRERKGRVQVVGADRIRSRRFEAVIVGGLTAGECPRRGGGDRLEGEAVRRARAALGLSPDEGEAERERLLFYLTVTHARRALVLVRQEADGDGAAVRPSVFWDELLDLYRDPLDDPPLDGTLPPCERLTLAELARERAVGAGAPKAYDGLRDPRVLGRLGERQVFSASELESYAGCPHRWFLERALGPESPDIALDGRALGSLVHAALAETYRTLPGRLGVSRVTAGCSAEARSIAGECFARAAADAPVPVTVEEQESLDAAERDVCRLVERDAAFLPSCTPESIEWSFGESDSDAEDLGGFRLAGRVDRIDVGPEGLVIVDYKLSQAPKLAELEDRRLLQLQLYAAVASRRLERPVAGALYRGVRSAQDRGFFLSGLPGPGLVRTDAVDADTLAAVVQAGVDAARRAADGIRIGIIDPDPEKERCRWCAWATACEAAL